MCFWTGLYTDQFLTGIVLDRAVYRSVSDRDVLDRAVYRSVSDRDVSGQGCV